MRAVLIFVLAACVLSLNSVETVRSVGRSARLLGAMTAADAAGPGARRGRGRPPHDEDTGVFVTVAAQEEPTVVFGTTVVIPSGLRGLVYYIKHNRTELPNFEKMKASGPAIYTSSLNVPAQDFRQGFPGVTKRVEWFAIDYTGRFWISMPGSYRFNMLSDDGAKLYIDDQVVVDNDGIHPPRWKDGSIELAGGIHRIRVSYFQGPKWAVALVLKVAGPGQQLRVFSTDEFKPPPDPGQWRFPEKGPDPQK